VLVSGAGTNLQALIDACRDEAYGAQVVAVGADRPGITALGSGRTGRDPLLHPPPARLPQSRGVGRCARPHLRRLPARPVVLAGFMKLVGKEFLGVFGGRCLNTHPALLPSFPGTHGVRDALAHGVKVTGCTVFIVDEGVDAGPIVAQASVPVADDDDEATLHERIKVAERALLAGTVGAMVRDGWSVRGRKVRIGPCLETP
jgi:phosphoribosylglycinamide formyltransferase, formyltetrahydrofolate-dependent